MLSGQKGGRRQKTGRNVQQQRRGRIVAVAARKKIKKHYPSTFYRFSTIFFDLKMDRRLSADGMSFDYISQVSAR
jgi:hypothetical protein